MNDKPIQVGDWVSAPDGYREDGTPRARRIGKLFAVIENAASVWWDDDGSSSQCALTSLRKIEAQKGEA